MTYMKMLFTSLAVALLAGCAARQPVPLTLAELDEQEQAYKTDVAKMSIPELCSEYRSQGTTKYRARFKKVVSAEIKKRNVWSKMEWDLIQNHQIATAVSEKLVRCSWGDPTSVNTTSTSHAVYKTMVYSSSYVYTHNGIVMTIQTSSSY
jgi:hypothetical protein